MYNTNGFSKTKSIFGMKGAAFKNPVSLTKTYYSVEDLSALTDAKYQEEYNRLQNVKKKYIRDTQRLLTEQERRNSLQEKLE